MRLRLLAATLLALYGAVPVAQADKWKGRAMSASFVATPLAKLAQLTADVGAISAVVLDGAATPLDLEVQDRPWDAVLDDLVKRAGLAVHRDGGLFVIGTPVRIAGFAARQHAYHGMLASARFSDIDAQAALDLLAAVGGPAKQVEAGQRRAVRMVVRQRRLDEIADLVAMQAGVTLSPSTAVTSDGECTAEQVPLHQLTVVGVVGPGGAASLVDTANRSYRAKKGGCVGAEHARLRAVGSDYVVYSVSGADQRVEVRP